MDTNQPQPQPASTTTYTSAPANTGMFGTKVPSAAAFLIAILVFLLPFSEIKCGGSSFMSKSGLDYALGNEWKFAGGYGKDMMKDMGTQTGGGEKEGNARIFILAALAMGVVGLLLTFANGKTGGGIGMVAGILGAGVLIAFMLDLKKWFSDGLAKQAAEKSVDGADSLGLDKMGDAMGKMQPTLAFTPWFYIAIVAFFAAAFFAYRRMVAARA